jgi:alpha-galactosidase
MNEKKTPARNLWALSSLILAIAWVTPLQATKFEGLALTPPMGWNSWNTFKTDISEELIKEIADAMIANGMRDAGYNYINLDDGWMAMERDDQGNLMAHPERFPNGMRVVADYLHERGFKFGVYNCAGSKTCAGYPGSMGHEQQDAIKYAQWGVDYLKYDWCNTGTRDPKEAMRTMSAALRAAGRPIVFSLCEWGTSNVWEWGKEVGHLWRTTGDIMDCYDCTQLWETGWKNILDAQMDVIAGHTGLETFAGPDGWNDPDMMVVGMEGLTPADNRTHFAMWCMLAAPLILGNDVRNIDPEALAVLTNREAIAVNQDALGKQGFRFFKDPRREVWLRQLAGDAWAVAIINPSEETRDTGFAWEIAHRFLEGTYMIRDIYQGKDLGTTADMPSIQRSLEPHDIVFLRLTPVK